MQTRIRIAILGTRGIPNNYGGFEQCAEKISSYFVQKGHDVTVYNPSEHFYKRDEWNGIKIKRISSNEKKFKSLGTFVFDYLSLKDVLKGNFDVVLELGYSASTFFYNLKRKSRSKIITNMAGLEWKRSKWNTLTKRIIKYCEKLAVEKSNALIADNPGIRDYLLKEYGKESFYIPYGAELFYNPKEEFLKEYGVEKYNYFILIARFQPDNNIEMILDGYVLSKANESFVVVGNYSNNYGKFLKKKYKEYPKVRFVDGIYNYEILSSLRWFSKLYFHGHSCGGTNPSLLEAMASNAYIAAHDNIFNRYVLEGNGFYFRNAEEISSLINNYREDNRDEFIKKNKDKIGTCYNWIEVSEGYLKVIEKVLESATFH